MLRLLIDTSIWLDLATSRDGQKWIVPLRVLAFQKKLELLVPAVVIEEFSCNRPRLEAAVTTSIVDRLRQLRRELRDFAGDRNEHVWLEETRQHIPLVNTTAPQNFREIAKLLRRGETLVPTELEYSRVVQRGLDKKAPFSSDKNSVADALLIELYATQTGQADSADVYCFATSNHRDFSVPNGDRRQPHPDLAELFASTQSRYCYGIEGLDEALTEYLGHDFLNEKEEVGFIISAGEPRTLDEIVQAEQEYFDRVWYVRRVVHSETGDVSYPDLEAKYGRDELWKPIGEGHDKAWKYGYISGKLAALRWVLGSEWDFLDL
ncbi:MAG TPA: PIN domain-containing protein [Streptosporangiaceae bacterium]|nr:PIN domain-containing protein [Streptosporangiaceae bacterium]